MSRFAVHGALRREWLLWLGALGGAITLLGSIEPLLTLAGWAKYLVETWRFWSHSFWDWMMLTLGFGWPLSRLAKDILTLDALVTLIGFRTFVGWALVGHHDVSAGLQRIGRLLGTSASAVIGIVLMIATVVVTITTQPVETRTPEVADLYVFGLSFVYVVVLNFIGNLFGSKFMALFALFTLRTFELFGVILALSYLSSWVAGLKPFVFRSVG